MVGSESHAAGGDCEYGDRDGSFVCGHSAGREGDAKRIGFVYRVTYGCMDVKN